MPRRNNNGRRVIYPEYAGMDLAVPLLKYEELSPLASIDTISTYPAFFSVYWLVIMIIFTNGFLGFAVEFLR